MRIEKSSINLFKIFFIIIECINYVQAFDWEYRTLYVKPPFYQILMNKVNKELIVSGNNALYKFETGDTIKNIDKFDIRDELQDLKCLNPEEDCERKRAFVNDTNFKILLIDYQNITSPIIIACGDSFLCYKFNANNFKDRKIVGTPNNSLNFIGSKKSCYAFFAPFHGQNVLFVAHSYDGRDFAQSPPLISLRKLDNDRGFSLIHSSASVGINSKFKNSSNINFIYGFNHNNYSYFLSTQPTNIINIINIINVTKLIRISKKNDSSISFMEIMLSCKKGSDFKNTTFNENYSSQQTDQKLNSRAKTAYFGKIGPKQFKDYEITDGEDTYALYVVFNDKMKSTVCAFSIKQIEIAFVEVNQKYFSNVSNNDKLESFSPKKRISQISQVDHDLYESNFIISSDVSLFGLYLNTFEGNITSLAVTVQKSNTIGIIGTECGKLMKVLFDKSQSSKKILFEKLITEIKFTHNIPKKPEREDSFYQHIVPNPVFDLEEKNLYLFTHHTIVKVPIGSCSFYEDCLSCIESTDPMGCGRCHYECIGKQDKCYKSPDDFPIERISCQPKIEDFFPKNSTTNGGKLVNIFLKVINNTEINNISVTIAKEKCDIQYFNNSVIQCMTGPSEEEVSGHVEVNFTLKDISGWSETSREYPLTNTSEQIFHYENETQNSALHIIIKSFIIVISIVFVTTGILFLRTRLKNKNIVNGRYVSINCENLGIELETLNQPNNLSNQFLCSRIKKEFIESHREEIIFIERADIDFDRKNEIGKGNFACVYKGILFTKESGNEEVAVKVLHSSSIFDSQNITLILKEALLMNELNHCNVLKLRGISFDTDYSPLVLSPYMKNGDLLTYIRDTKNLLPIKDLLNFAFQIAKGMEYLSNHRCIHRDLAARNCLLDSDLCVKISDFGLSRDIQDKDYYRIKNSNCELPIKWMSPESLELGTFDSKSDVWSYGVVVWELLTRGEKPYPLISTYEGIKNHLKGGNRLPKPQDCPDFLYSVLEKCWSYKSESRPDFSILIIQMQQFLYEIE